MTKAHMERGHNLGQYHKAYAKRVDAARDRVERQSKAHIGGLPETLRVAGEYQTPRVKALLDAAANACAAAVTATEAHRAAERAVSAAEAAVDVVVRGDGAIIATVTAQVALEAAKSVLRLTTLVSGMEEDVQRHNSFVPNAA